MTIGPGAKPDQVATTGTASHIFSAAPDGPRGQGGLTEEQLESAMNGIWLCNTHGRLIDANEGNAYPASYLISIRNLHEAWVAREQGSIGAPFGWVQEMEVVRSELFRDNSMIRFGKVTVVLGMNNSGKSALCEWILGASSPSALWRWLRHRAEDGAVRYRIRYFDRWNTSCLSLPRLTPCGTCWIGGRSRKSDPFGVVRDSATAGFNELSDLEQMAALVGIDPVVARNLLHVTPTNPTFSRCVVDVDGFVQLDVRGTAPGLTWGGLSGGEQVSVISNSPWRWQMSKPISAHGPGA